MRQPSRSSWLTAAMAFALATSTACGGDVVAPKNDAGGTGTPRSDDSLQSLRAAAGAPAIANPVVTFYAKKGEDRTAFMYYQPQGSGRDSAVFLRLRVRQRSLDQLPDGSPIADGDSVLITITLIDPTRLIVDCQPAGLRFAVSDPADLKLSYLETDPDINDDGTVNAADQQLLQQLQIWRRESPGALWQPLASEESPETHEVETEIGGFTSYAIAY